MGHKENLKFAKEMEKLQPINRYNPKIFIISIIYGIIILAIFYYVVTDILGSTLSFITKIIILLLAIQFIYEKIVTRSSEVLVKMFEGMTKGKSIKESFDETLEKEELN